MNAPVRPDTRSSSAPRRGFSLVEILIAILVLAFGLLGLAAVFPVVVTQQRDAADTTFGPAAARTVDLQVFGETGIIDWANVRDTVFAFPSGDPNDWAATRTATTQDGDLRIAPGLGGSPTELVPATARLVPAPFGGVTPRYVWDVVARRPDRDPDLLGYQAGPLEVAVFVRRIDTGIRVPEDKSIANVLTGVGLTNPNARALPVAIDPSSGRPSNNGVGRYAGIEEIKNVRPDEGASDVYDRLDVTRGMTGVQRALISRRGQKLLDSHGVVRTVTQVDSEGRVVVSPPFPNDDQVQLIYTPHVPVSVRVITIESDG